MSFEDDVLTSVNKLLTPGDEARFTHGKLFVRCTEQTANAIHSTLLADFPGTSVTLTKWATSTEFTFDFLTT